MTVARTFALVFGAIYVIIGILGFIRPLTDAPPDGLVVMGTTNLLGIFTINWFHNLAHLLIGVFGLVTAARTSSARAYAGIVGITYALLFVIGLFTNNFLDILPLNSADNVLHLVSAVLALAVAFTPFGLMILGSRERAVV